MLGAIIEVRPDDRVLQIVAGPGSGKTEVLVWRALFELLVRGSESWAPDPEAEGHASAFRDPHILTVEGAGHWVHHDQLAAFLRAVRGFVS